MAVASLFGNLCLGSVAQASSAVTQPEENSSVVLRYAVFVHGLHVLDAEGTYALRPWGYGGVTHMYTVGLASWFLTVDITSTVEGRFVDGKAAPVFYDSKGYSRGANRHVHVSFGINGPHVDILTPPDDPREPLPENQYRSSIDLMSALGQLFHTLDTKGTCEMSGTVFDGMRLTHVDAHGPKKEAIPQNHGIYISGPAQRCDFIGRQSGGFVIGSHHKALLASPQPGAAWFRTIQGIGIVPVRIDFHHPKLGRIIMVMQEEPHHADTITYAPPPSTLKHTSHPVRQ